MQKRQFNREQYFNEQFYTTKRYVIPYIEETMTITSDTKVAEIGCGDGGNLKPFLDSGCKVVGIDISEWKLSYAKKFFEDHPQKENLTLINKNIFDIQSNDFLFDLVIIRDTLEHIPNQYLLLEHVKKFLAPNGKIFISFPAWRMPFGGHQQMCKSNFLSKCPYFHIFPKIFYRSILKIFGESDGAVQGLMEIKATRISIQDYQQIVHSRKYKIEKQTYFLINPNYEIKFKLKPVKLPLFINIPYVRDFFVTTVYSIISSNN